jgi:hypothetical protein
MNKGEVGMWTIGTFVVGYVVGHFFHDDVKKGFRLLKDKIKSNL